MFTGLVEGVGRVELLEGDDHGKRIVVSTPLGGELRPGDSIAVSGVCLTATACDGQGFSADVSRQTLSVTTLAGLQKGGLVNLERPVRADARLGGHFVLGHVDEVGRITAFGEDGAAHWLDVAVPAALTPYLIPKGSIAIDGISLTIASLDGERVGLQIVPFTRSHTSLRESRVGDAVNVEADILGKYVARLLAMGQTAGAHVPAGL
jgi:riboflavin synthase